MFANQPFYALVFTGVISFVLIGILLLNLKQLIRLAPSKQIVMFSLLGLVIGIHGILHAVVSYTAVT